MTSRSNHLPKALTLLLAIGCALLPLVGCGGASKGVISGTVVRTDGTPAASMRVTARSDATGDWAADTTDASGHYELKSGKNDDGLPAGDYDVIVVEEQGGSDSKPATIAAKYGSPTESGLSVKLVAGEDQTLDVTVDPP